MDSISCLFCDKEEPVLPDESLDKAAYRLAGRIVSYK